MSVISLPAPEWKQNSDFGHEREAYWAGIQDLRCWKPDIHALTYKLLEGYLLHTGANGHRLMARRTSGTFRPHD